MLYSVIICTYNRYPLNKETIYAVLRVVGYRNDIEILIIDNNSNDATSQLEVEFKDYSNIRYYIENKQGLSHARNRGIKESKGEVLIYLDDDIDIVDSYFNICDEIFKDKRVQYVGGKVLPYKVGIPAWLPEKFYYLVSIFDLGNKPQITKYVMGGNSAIRKVIATEIGEFNTQLGRNGKSLGGSEEIDYQNRARALGVQIHYNPHLNILHKINNKLNKEYILNYAYQHSKSEFLIAKSRHNNIVKKKAIGYFVLLLCKMSFLFIFLNEKQKMYLEIRHKYALGYLGFEFKKIYK